MQLCCLPPNNGKSFFLKGEQIPHILPHSCPVGGGMGLKANCSPSIIVKKKCCLPRKSSHVPFPREVGQSCNSQCCVKHSKNIHILG